MKRATMASGTGVLVITALTVVFLSSPSHAAIPLITDDTGTQGRGKFQVELFGEYGRDESERITVSSSNLAATLTYGITDPLDVALGIPYQYSRTKDPESTVKGDGLADLAVEVKWRFYDAEGLSFALKPGLTIPAGDAQKGLGTGRTTYYLSLIASKETGPWATHANLTYTRNENNVSQRNNLWRASVASTFEAMKNLRLVADIGVGTNPDRSLNTPPAYLLGGFIYSIHNDFDIGLGVKGGLTKPETDIALRGGITWRF